MRTIKNVRYFKITTTFRQYHANISHLCRTPLVCVFNLNCNYLWEDLSGAFLLKKFCSGAHTQFRSGGNCYAGDRGQPCKGPGMLGALAIVWFRTNFRDPRDIIFMFASLAAGISVVVKGYTIATGGVIGFCVIAVILYFSPFGQTSYFDGMLWFNL